MNFAIQTTYLKKRQCARSAGCGLEFSDRTAQELLALPMSREIITTANFILADRAKRAGMIIGRGISLIQSGQTTLSPVFGTQPWSNNDSRF
jgi:hypothetical protein